MERLMEKVTVFITREKDGQQELLLFEHPNAGIQLPGGTVEVGESCQDATFREAWEETGLKDLELVSQIGHHDTQLPEGMYMVCQKTKVYSQPDLTSFDWAEFRRGIQVEQWRESGDFVQVQYVEHDSFPECNYVTYSILGWVPAESLARRVRRTFYHLSYSGNTSERWTQFSDNHNFKLFWAPIVRLPKLVEPQQQWVEYVLGELKYHL